MAVFCVSNDRRYEIIWNWKTCGIPGKDIFEVINEGVGNDLPIYGPGTIIIFKACNVVPVPPIQSCCVEKPCVSKFVLRFLFP